MIIEATGHIAGETTTTEEQDYTIEVAYCTTCKEIVSTATTIIKYNAAATELKIPTTLKGMQVTAIGSSAFKNCTNLKSIEIPKSVTTIGSNAFEGCSNLTIVCYENSAAHTYAEANNINYILVDKKDVTAPEVKVTYNPTDKTNGNVIVTITANEALQEVTGWILSSDKKVLTKTYSANTEETVTIKDLAGNIASVKVTINNIDKITPEGKVSYNPTTPTNGKVTATITASEELQEVTGWTLSSNKKVLTKTYSANAEETVTIKDLEGNTKAVQVVINNIDKIAPTATVSYDGDKKVTVTITANEALQDVTGWTLSSNKKVLTKTYSANAEETVTIKDLAGNTKAVEVKITIETSSSTEENNINKDVDGDGKPDINIDTNGDNKADINIDTNGDNKADINIDINGDNKADINIDTNGDNKADINIDTNGDNKPDVNIDTNGDNKADTNITNTGSGTSSKDGTTTNSPIPQTGDKAYFVVTIIVVLVLGTLGFVKYKKYNRYI